MLRKQKNNAISAHCSQPRPVDVHTTPEESARMSDLLEKLIHDFPESISDTLVNRKLRECEEMTIKLRDDIVIKPCYVTTAKSVPIHYKKTADSMLDDMIREGIIYETTEPSNWCSPGFFIEKGDRKSLRFVTDFSILNRQVKRIPHPFMSVQEVIQRLPRGALYFATMDACHGYWQVSVRPEDRHFLTFLVYRGRYTYARCPQGYSGSSDIFLRITDKIMENLDGVLKLVDDLLVYGKTLDELEKRIMALMERLKQSGLTVSKKKLNISRTVSFAGFRLSPDSIEPDPARIAALTELPAPKSLSELRGYNGALNQLSIFIPDLAHHLHTTNGLLKGKTAFLWTDKHEAAFQKSKEMLKSQLKLTFFDENKATFLLTDASYSGLSAALCQPKDGAELDKEGTPKAFTLIAATSRSLKNAELNYSVSEIETLAILYGLKKFRHYLAGNQSVTVLTDHRAICGIMGKPLAELQNSRLCRMRMSMSDFSFAVRYVVGKLHYLADVMSRLPYFKPSDKEVVFCKTITSHDILHKDDPDRDTIEYDPLFQPLRRAAETCEKYKEMVAFFKARKRFTRQTIHHPIWPYQPIWNNMSLEEPLLMFNDKIIVPFNYRKTLLELIHSPCNGDVKTLSLCRKYYYWDTMKHDIQVFCMACKSCNQHKPSQRAETLRLFDATRPLESLGIDLWYLNSKSFFVMACRYTAFLWVRQLTNESTRHLINKLDDIFDIMGFKPRILRSDKGPQFKNAAFATWCKQNDITHKHSSPFFASSNGHAEAFVKKAKRCLEKNGGVYNEKYLKAISVLRQTPITFGRKDTQISPTEMVYGFQTRGALPTLPRQMTPANKRMVEEARAHYYGQRKDYHDKHALDLSLLRVGAHVLMQDNVTKKWSREGIVKKVRESGRQYQILSEGRLVERNRRHLRPNGDKNSNFKKVHFSSPLKVEWID